MAPRRPRQSSELGTTQAGCAATRPRLVPRHEGHPNAAGVDADVTFTDVGATVEDRVDAAYRDKYRRCAASIIDSMNCPGAAETTVRVVPR
ncbi:DUF2255 family protein [Nocardia aurea]|uniref:DUF2255 family protein n=1 Tax=Nocardia aurea TaxID=2144174 RepID=A0ABV3FVU2_9NOCA